MIMVLGQMWEMLLFAGGVPRVLTYPSCISGATW